MEQRISPTEEALSRICEAKEKQLAELDLASLRLTSVPAEIAELEQLTSLHLRFNQLSELPPEIAELQQLTSLDLSYNQLSELPPEIAELQQLTSLDLSDNRLSELPPEITELQQLTSLDLGYNLLSELPAEVTKLQQLTSLNLSGNRLSELPAEITELQQLTSLHLRSAQLTELPEAVLRLPKITGPASLIGNQLTNPPQGIANWGWEAVLYYRGNYDDSRCTALGLLKKVLIRGFNPPGIEKNANLPAILQTVAISLIAISLAVDIAPTVFWVSVLVSPLLLLRTEKSINAGLQCFNWLTRRLRPKNVSGAVAAFFVTGVLGLAALLIKVFITPVYALLHLPLVLKTLPENYRFYFAKCSLMDLPELLPNMDQHYANDSKHHFSLYDLGYDFADGVGLEFTQQSRRQWGGIVGIGVFFIFAFTFRVTVKASALFYALPVYVFLRGRMPNDDSVNATHPLPDKARWLARISLLTVITGLMFWPSVVDLQSLLEKVQFINVEEAERLLAPHIDDFVAFCLRPQLFDIPFMLLPLAIAWLHTLIPLATGFINNTSMKNTVRQCLQVLDYVGYLSVGIYFSLVGMELLKPYLALLAY